MIKQLFSAFVFVAYLFLPVNSTLAAVNSPVGLWTTIDDETGKARSIIRISQRGNEYFGTILKVFKQPGDTGICSKCPGRFKNKKIVGLTIMWGVHQTGRNVWSGGRILDPKKGSIYRVKFSLTRGGRALDVRGYIGFSLFGRTQTWLRR